MPKFPVNKMIDLQKKCPWVLDTLSYDWIENLIKALKIALYRSAIQKHNELRLIKAREPKIRSANDFIDDKGLNNQSNSVLHRYIKNPPHLAVFVSEIHRASVLLHSAARTLLISGKIEAILSARAT